MSQQIKTTMRDDAFAVRRAVFMDEQGYEKEFDGIDDHPSCVHMTLYIDGDLAGCSRVFPELLERALVPESPQSPRCTFDGGVTAGETYLLGRVAVMPAFRRRGLASVIIAASDEAARKAGAKLVKLHAQEYAHDLYSKQGYTQISDIDHEDEGQPHLWMAKRL